MHLKTLTLESFVLKQNLLDSMIDANCNHAHDEYDEEDGESFLFCFSNGRLVEHTTCSEQKRRQNTPSENRTSDLR
jgi:hypothetical protein